MNLQQIQNTINDYDKLIDLAKSKIKVIENLDDKYTAARGIEEISFEEDIVSVRCDDTVCGCYESYNFSFPLEWLSKTDDELKELVVKEREIRLEKQRKAEEEKQKQDAEKYEELEKEQYLRLKAKYENEV
jgi:hypothetical protein